MNIFFSILALGTLLIATPSFADPNKPYDKAYASGTGRKFERGVSNVTMGWMEVPREIALQGKNNGVAAACLWGPIKGLGQAIHRTAIGAYETVTFPLGTHPTFTPLTQPEFVLDKNGSKP